MSRKLMIELCGSELLVLLDELEEWEVLIDGKEKKKIKKTYCIAITTKGKPCRNYAWKKCEEQLCYSHRNLVGTEPDLEKEEEQEINEAIESFELEI